MTTIVRPCEEGDIGAVSAIYAEAVIGGTASFEIEPPAEAEMARRRAALLASAYPYFVGEATGAVAGFAYAGPYRSRPAYRYTVENSIYVAPDRQRAGIGRALMTVLLKACEERGYRQMIAVIGDSASTGSIRLHEALGFRLVGVFEASGFKHGRWLDTVLMQRALGDGTASAPGDA